MIVCDCDMKAAVINTFDSFRMPKACPYKKIDGVRLMITPSGYGLREDGVGKLIPVSKADILIGRDDHRARAAIRNLARSISQEVARLVVVNRCDAIGKAKRFETKPTKRRFCMVTVGADGEFVLPQPFVVYESKKGRKIYRSLI